MPVLARTISFHRFVYFDKNGESKSFTNSPESKLEGTDSERYLWDVRNNIVFKCEHGKRERINVRWASAESKHQEEMS